MAALGSGEYSGSVQNLINLTENLDCYDYLSGIENDWDIGNYWIEESGCYDTEKMGQLAYYFDYERFRRDIRLEEGGTFTYKGYVRCNGSSFYEDYDGKKIPMSIRCLPCRSRRRRWRRRLSPIAIEGQGEQVYQ